MTKQQTSAVHRSATLGSAADTAALTLPTGRRNFSQTPHTLHLNHHELSYRVPPDLWDFRPVKAVSHGAGGHRE